MNNAYNALTQLKILKLRYQAECDSQKVDALDFAIKAVVEQVHNTEPCYFDEGEECRALMTKDCVGCPFKKTKEKWDADRKKARIRHRLITLGTIETEQTPKVTRGDYIVIDYEGD